jgi:hypothetical protein
MWLHNGQTLKERFEITFEWTPPFQTFGWQKLQNGAVSLNLPDH